VAGITLMSLELDQNYACVPSPRIIYSIKDGRESRLKAENCDYMDVDDAIPSRWLPLHDF
jgi:hypothetical protein